MLNYFHKSLGGLVSMKIYEQISHDIKKKIITEQIPQGAKLPSIESLSKEYKCSKGTVIKAYNTLCSEHIVYSSPQSGFYVADNLVRFHKTQTNIYDLSTGNSLVNNIPIKDIQHCLNSALELHSNMSLNMDLEGLPSLRAILTDLLVKDDIYSKNKNLILSQGILQVLTLFSKMKFPNGNDTILIEDPSYAYYINFLKYENIKVKTIKRDENGINLDELEEIFKTQNIKFFYTIPRNHNPLGTYYPLEQKKAIMKLAHIYNVYIIEDDYFSDLSTLSRYSPLYYYSDFKNCIHLRSFSKTIPYIRIGVAIIPDDLIASFKEWMRYSYYFSYYMPSLVSQATLESYIKSSIYNKHTTILSKNLRDLLKLFRKITSTWDSNFVTILGGRSGYYSTIRLSHNIDCNKLLNNLKAKNVLLTSNSVSYYNEDNFDNSLRLSIAKVNSTDLKIALNIIYDEILKLSS